MNARWVVLGVLVACGGGGKGGAPAAQPKEATPTPLDPALNDRCGINGDSDPVTQKIGDLEACRTIIVAAMAGRDTGYASPNDVAEALCMKEEARTATKGIACRYQADKYHRRGEPRGAAVVLDLACKAGNQESCTILKTKKDDKGETWELDIPAE